MVNSDASSDYLAAVVVVVLEPAFGSKVLAAIAAGSPTSLVLVGLPPLETTNLPFFTVTAYVQPVIGYLP